MPNIHATLSCCPKPKKHEVLVITRGATAFLDFDLSKKVYTFEDLDQFSILLKQNRTVYQFDAIEYYQLTTDSAAQVGITYYTRVDSNKISKYKFVETIVAIGDSVEGLYVKYELQDGEITDNWQLNNHFIVSNDYKLINFRLDPDETTKLETTNEYNKVLLETAVKVNSDTITGFNGKDSILIDRWHYLDVINSIYAKPRCAAPTIVLTNNILSWNKVTGAVCYDIYVNNIALIYNVKDLSYDLSEKITAIGNYTIKIKAVGNDKFKDSEFSNIINYTVNYKMYFGVSFSIPTTIYDTFYNEQCPENLLADGAIHYFTTKVSGEERGQYPIFAYPTVYGDLAHIYCNDLTDAQFDLISDWTKSEIVYNNINYNLYYSNVTTKEENSKYQFLFK